MKKWIITALVVITLAALALYHSYWLPQLLSFVGINTDLIQGLSDLVQLLLWAGALILIIWRLWRPRKEAAQKPQLEPSKTITATGRGVAAEKVKDSSVITGDENVSVSHSNVSGTVAGRDVITNIYEAPASAALALHQLPPPPKDFTGRKAELDQLLAEHSRGRSVFLLHGMGGIGKTVLALEFADQLKAIYPDAQFHLDLRGTSSVPLSQADIQSHVIRACHPTTKLPENEQELSALFNSLLHGKHVLLLLDNAESSDQLNPVAPPDGCALVITSRTLFHLPDLFTIKVETMTEDDARELLLRIAPKIGHQADTIAKLCGHLPLALRLASSALRERVDLSADRYVQLLADKQGILKLIDASISLSYELLDEQRQKIWRELAVFADTFNIKAAAAVWQMNQDEAQEHLSDFVKGSLVEWNGATQRYSLHDLVQLFADEQLQQAERSHVQNLHAQHYLEVLWEIDQLYKEGDEDLLQALSLFDLERSNIQAGQAWSCSNSSNIEAAIICSEYPHAGAFLLDLRQHPREKIAWREAALEAAHKIKDRRMEGLHLGHLGIAYATLGETRKAIEFFERDLAIAREINESEGEGASLSNLGTAYLTLREFRKAIKFYDQALIITRKIEDRRGEGTVLGNLGLAYRNLGEPLKAIEFHEQALIIDREIGDRRGEGADLGGLGLAYEALGEIRKAIAFYEQALIVTREIGDRMNEGLSLCNLGLSYAKLGEIRKAIECYDQAFIIAREIDDKIGEGKTLFNKALSLYRLGDKQQATAHMRAALAIFEAIESPGASRAKKLLNQWRQTK